MDHMQIREHINLVEETTRPAKLETTPLPYGLKDLEPVISRATLEYHYEHLAKNYAHRYNSDQGDREFNRAGSYLHNKLFVQFRTPKVRNRPKGASAELIENTFKTFEDFQSAFKETAMKLQGSGWIYLSTTGEIKTIKNHSVRTDIALILDMWEHAFALDWKWDKEGYIDGFWKIIDWNVVNERL